MCKYVCTFLSCLDYTIFSLKVHFSDEHFTDLFVYEVTKLSMISDEMHLSYNSNTRLRALFPGLPGWAGTRKEKPIWILLKQETVSGSGIRWAVCKSAPRSRQITTPVPHPVVKVDRRISWHYTTTTILRLTRYRNCKFHNGCRTISRHADGISRYSVPPSAGPLLPLTPAQNFLQAGCPTNSVKALKAFEMLMHPYLTKILKESYSMVHQMCANFLQHVVFLKQLQSGLLLVTGIEMLYLYSLLLIWWCFLYSFTMAIEWIDQPLLCYYCKKLNSLKHLVRTTVAESHN